MTKSGTNSNRNIIFVGLMLGMLVAVTNQTMVSPAMPVMVAELGGIEHYSWIATSALLAVAVSVPVVGKLSDIYGRRSFYIWGLIIFMLGSILAGMAQGFWWLVGARAVQGLGMGVLQTLSQTIIGDIISPRERGKYMGYVGGVFGIALIAGPLAGGWITEVFSWRWLFFVNLPLGVAALLFVIAFLHLPHVPMRHSVDYVGFVTLGLGLCAVLLATSWGGAQYPWGSWQIISLYIASAVLLLGFIINEHYAEEPVVPLRLWKNSVFTLSNLSNVAVGMAMFGAVFFIPLYVQGVIGASVTNSGALLIPLMFSAIVLSILVGRLITRTGRYKGFVIAGLIVMGAGYYLLSRLGYDPTQTDLTVAMVLLGIGLGGVMQTYVLIVQNATSRRDLGIATSITQLTRSMGATFGTAIFGTVMVGSMKSEIPKHLPPETLNSSQAERYFDGRGVGSLLDPSALGQLSPAIATGIREGLSAALHSVFLVGLMIIGIALVASVFIKELPLRDTAFADEDIGEQVDPDPNAGEGAYARDRRDERFAGQQDTYLNVLGEEALLGLSMDRKAAGLEGAMKGEVVRKLSAAVGSAVFFVLVPGTAVGLVPWWITDWEIREPLSYWAPARVVGASLIVAGAAVLIHAFARFVVEGLGTPAPVAPPEHLVVGGFYRYVRNPMYVAVLAIIVGQALALGQLILLAYAVAAWIAFASFVHFYEEPALSRRFGARYEAYRRAVPAWWPRLRPWRTGERDSPGAR